jgi:hypothetical protein
MQNDQLKSDVELLQEDNTRDKSSIIIAQYKVASATATRFVKWLSAVKELDVSDAWKEFVTFNDDELDRIGSRLNIEFGKYKGRTYYEVWSTVEGRRYLEWAVKQDWLYDEPAATIKALIKMSTPVASQSSKKVKNYNKRNNPKKKAPTAKKSTTAGSKSNKPKKRKAVAPTFDSATDTLVSSQSDVEADEDEDIKSAPAAQPAKSSSRKRTKIKITSQ